MKRNVFIMIGFVICIALVVLNIVLAKSAHAPSQETFTTIEIQGRILRVELAQTLSAQMQGLSHRDATGSDGMLFVFEPMQSARFWMKDMRFPLDMIWIREGRIVGIDRGVQPPLATGTIEARQSPGEITAVLEVEAGNADWMQVGQIITPSY